MYAVEFSDTKYLRSKHRLELLLLTNVGDGAALVSEFYKIVKHDVR